MNGGGIVVKLAPNAILMANYEGMNWEEALKLLKELDWQKIRELFGS
ncbi:hypothetical protein [Nitratifractor sp.]